MHVIRSAKNKYVIYWYSAAVYLIRKADVITNLNKDKYIVTY